MKSSKFKKLFCVMLSAGILLPNVANADNRPNLHPVAQNTHSATPIKDFFKENWIYFAGGVPGVIALGTGLGLLAKYGRANNVPNASGDVINEVPAEYKTDADWSKEIQSCTEQGKLPGAIVFSQPIMASNKLVSAAVNACTNNFYFFIITDSTEFDEFLKHEIGENNTESIKFVKRWANKVIYAPGSTNSCGYDYQNLFLKSSDTAKFAAHLKNAIDTLNAPANKEKLTGNKGKIRAHDLNKYLQNGVQTIISNAAGARVLNDIGLGLLLCPTGNPLKVTDGDLSLMKMSVDTSSPSQCPTTTTTTVATAHVLLSAAQPIACSVDSADTLQTSASNQLMPKPSTPNFGYVHGIRFYRRGHELIQPTRTVSAQSAGGGVQPTNWVGTLIDASTNALGACRNVCTNTYNAVAKGYDTVTNNGDATATRHCFIVEHPSKVFKWIGGLVADNKLTQEDARKTIDKIFKFQNRFLYGKCATDYVYAGWSLSGVFGKALDDFWTTEWENNEARQCNTQLIFDTTTEEAIKENGLAPLKFGNIVFTKNDKHISDFCNGIDDCTVGSAYLLNNGITNINDLSGETNWSDYDKLYGYNLGTFENLYKQYIAQKDAQ